MNWEAMATAQQLIAADQQDQAARLLRDLRQHYGHPAAGTLLASALQAAGDAAAAEAILAEDCALGIADHWTWLARAAIADHAGKIKHASTCRAHAYQYLGWTDCPQKGLHFPQDELSRHLRRWHRVMQHLVNQGPIRVLAIGLRGDGVFPIWALDQAANRMARLDTFGEFSTTFSLNLARLNSPTSIRIQASLNASPDSLVSQLADSEQHREWDLIHISRYDVYSEGIANQLRSFLAPGGIFLSDDVAVPASNPMVARGIWIAGWRP